MLRLVHPAPKGKVPARPKYQRSGALTPTPLESDRIRATLRNLKLAFGGWDVLAAVLNVKPEHIKNVFYRVSPGSYALAVLLARAAGVTVEQVLSDRPHEAGKCPVCGRKGAR